MTSSLPSAVNRAVVLVVILSVVLAGVLVVARYGAPPWRLW